MGEPTGSGGNAVGAGALMKVFIRAGSYVNLALCVAYSCEVTYYRFFVHGSDELIVKCMAAASYNAIMYLFLRWSAAE
jgi:hypothetical protein